MSETPPSNRPRFAPTTPILLVTGFALGIVEGFTKVFYPEASNTVIFIIMAIVLLVRPAGLFGTQK